MARNELAEPPSIIPKDVSNLWWDERTRVDMMADKHLENAIQKLQGLGKSTYDASDEVKRRWLGILLTEQMNRVRDKRATKVD